MQLIKNLGSILFLQAPFYLLYALVLALVFVIFRLPDDQALQMLNISFPVVGILAGIAFSWAQCLPEGAKKEKAVLASKQFFHSLILLLLAILLKYVSIAHVPGMTLPRLVLIIMELLVYYAIGTGLAFFLAGVHTTSRCLWAGHGER